MKRIPLEGQKLGKWTVLTQSESDRGMTKYRCRCTCGSEQDVFAKHLRSGSSRGCHPCSVARGARHGQFTGVGEISGNWWGSHVGRSATLHARRPIELTLTIQQGWELFLAQDRKCALTGLPIHFPKSGNRKDKGTASLDRIDSDQGYVIGNVQWVHKTINLMKNALPQSVFVKMCIAVARNTEQ